MKRKYGRQIKVGRRRTYYRNTLAPAGHRVESAGPEVREFGTVQKGGRNNPKKLLVLRKTKEKGGRPREGIPRQWPADAGRNDGNLLRGKLV